MNKTPKKNTSKNRTSKEYCEKCGFKIRGENHEAGLHHQKGENNKYNPDRY